MGLSNLHCQCKERKCPAAGRSCHLAGFGASMGDWLGPAARSISSPSLWLALWAHGRGPHRATPVFFYLTCAIPFPNVIPDVAPPFSVLSLLSPAHSTNQLRQVFTKPHEVRPLSQHAAYQRNDTPFYGQLSFVTS
jgi:hypothetical protein